DNLVALGYFDAASTAATKENSPFIEYKNPNGTTEKAEPCVIRLSDALKFTDLDGAVRNLPAGTLVQLPAGPFRETPAFGAKFTNMLVDSGYMKTVYGVELGVNDPRSKLPPPLTREGERVQPDWLYKFLLNPTEIRPHDYILLRMPKFNMSPEESR